MAEMESDAHEASAMQFWSEKEREASNDDDGALASMAEMDSDAHKAMGLCVCGQTMRRRDNCPSPEESPSPESPTMRAGCPCPETRQIFGQL